MKKKILVTGDRGYIGSVLVPVLLEKGYEVIGLDTEFFTRNLVLAALPHYKRITQDIRDVTKEELSGIDSIIHLAALSNDPIGEIDPTLTEDINHKASTRLAAFAKEIGIPRFVFSSSCSIYGIAEEDIVDEQSKANPLTAYAKSKIATERTLQELADDSFCVGLMRNSTVYGYSPCFRNDLVVNNLTTSAVALGQLRIMSDGSPWRPLIDVRDLASCMVAFLEADAKKINGRIINVGFNTNNFQVKEIVEKIKTVLPECEVVFTGEHGSDTRSYKVKFDLFKKLFPKVSQKWNLDRSIADLVDKLKKAHYNKDVHVRGEYARLNVLKELLTEGKIDKKLYWTKK